MCGPALTHAAGTQGSGNPPAQAHINTWRLSSMKNDSRRKRLLAGLGVALALSAPAIATAGGPALAAPAALPAAPVNGLIIKYRSATAAAVVDAGTLGAARSAAARQGLGLKHVRRTSLGAHVMRLDRTLGFDEAQALAREIAAADPDVEYAEPDGRLYAQFTPNDTFYATQQWALFESTAGVNAPAAWDKATGSGVVVAVIDTGYRPHADLAANIVAGYDMISDAAEARDGNGRDSSALDEGDYAAAGECGAGEPASNSSWHGTHVAGTIAAVTNNAAGVAGLAFNAKVQPVRVLGRCGGTYADIADAIIWASGGTVTGIAANPTPAKVLNLSLGGSGACPATMQSAITSARSRGTVVVVAAGNSAVNVSNATPANCNGVVAVAAVGRTGARAYYSNFGALVDLAAQGGDMSSSNSGGIYSTLNAGTTTPGADSYAFYQGTSMATPHVAAVAALMLQANPALTPDDVEARLKSSTRAFPATCSQCGTGLLDANAAVIAANTTTTTVAEVESNNTLATAQAISANPALVNGSLASGDVDYYAITLAAGKTLSTTLTPPTTADFDLYIHNSSGTQLASSVLGTGAVDATSYTNSGSAAITIYVRVLRYSGTGSYTLRLSQ
jgi:serine protease